MTLATNQVIRFTVLGKPQPAGSKRAFMNPKTRRIVVTDDNKKFGDPDRWQLICKASSKAEGWMKSTKAMEVAGLGVIVQVTTQQQSYSLDGDAIAESVTFIPGAAIFTHGGKRSVAAAPPLPSKET